MSSSRYVSRHASPGRRRRSVPSLGGSRVTRTAMKSVAGVGIILGTGAFVIAPSSAIGGVDLDPGLVDAKQSMSAAEMMAERDAKGADASGPAVASRSAERAGGAAITAPDGSAQQSGAPDLGVEAVAKPKPKPKPEPPEEPEPPQTESESEEAPAPESSGVQADGYAAEAAALGLGPNASAVYSAVRNEFPDMDDIGGYRAGDPGDHGSGRAVDIMVTGPRGDQVNAWLQQHAGELNIKYIIWQQRIWYPSGESEAMEDRGSTTANHYDHVHVSVY